MYIYAQSLGAAVPRSVSNHKSKVEGPLAISYVQSIRDLDTHKADDPERSVVSASTQNCDWETNI